VNVGPDDIRRTHRRGRFRFQTNQPRQTSRFFGRKALDLHYQCPGIRSVGPRHSSCLVPQSDGVNLHRDSDWNSYSPLGPMSNSARRPSGPAATLIPKRIACWEGLSDFLGSLSSRRFILIFEGKRKPKWWTHTAKPHPFAGWCGDIAQWLPPDAAQTNPQKKENAESPPS